MRVCMFGQGGLESVKGVKWGQRVRWGELKGIGCYLGMMKIWPEVRKTVEEWNGGGGNEIKPKQTKLGGGKWLLVKVRAEEAESVSTTDTIAASDHPIQFWCQVWTFATHGSSQLKTLSFSSSFLCSTLESLFIFPTLLLFCKRWALHIPTVSFSIYN